MDTYAELTAAVQSRLGRTDLAAHYGDWVALAEKAIVSKLRVREMENIATIEPIDGEVTPPTDFLGVGEIRPSSNMEVELEYASEKLLFRYENVTLTEGRGFWSFLGNKIFIRPKPASTVWGLAGGTGEWGIAGSTTETWGVSTNYWMRYFSKPSALSDSNTTNELFPIYNDVYFDAVMHQAFKHVRNFETAKEYKDSALEMVRDYNTKWALEKEGEGSLQMPMPGPVA